MPSVHFVRGVQANLRYWQGQTAVTTSPNTLYREQSNMLNAVKFGLVLEETRPNAIDLTLQLFPLMSKHGAWEALRPFLEKATAVCPQDDLAKQYELLSYMGNTYRLNGQYDESKNYHLQALALAEQINDVARLIRTYIDLTADHLRLSQLEKGLEYAHMALNLAQEHALPELVPLVLELLGQIHLKLGKFVEAAETLQKAFDLAQDEGVEAQTQANILYHLSQVLLQQNQPEQALHILQQATSYLDETVEFLMYSRTLLLQGVIYFQLEDWGNAETCFLEANSALINFSSDIELKVSLQQNLGNVALRQGQLDKAEEYLRKAVTLWQKIENEVELANTIGTLAGVLARKGELTEAEQLYKQAIEILVLYPDNAWATRSLQIFQEKHLSFFREKV